MSKLCLGLIASNEERMLARHLPKLTESFDGEVVSIDYGSTDKTQEILRSHSKFTKTLPWSNDFGIAKTNLAGFAEESGYEWMFLIDADETIEDPDVQLIKRVISENPYDVYFTPRINYVSDTEVEGEVDGFPDLQARLFKLNVGFEYRSVRHCSLYRKGEEKAVWELRLGPVLPVFIRHYKCLKPKESQMTDELKRYASECGFPEVKSVEFGEIKEEVFKPKWPVKINNG